MKRYAVPSKDYARQYEPIRSELLAEIDRVLREENPVLGASLEAFEEEFATYTGTREAVGLNSGTDALCLALRTLGIGRGDEVITAANTFIATVSAIVLAGATPRLVDPDPETMNVTAAGLAGAVTPRTAAVIPVHLYGLLAPMDEIVAMAGARGLAVIEDAAQAHGACAGDTRRAGAFGRMGCFSFHPSKNLGAFGDGGAITLSDPADAAELRLLRNLGKATKYDVTRLAPNSKLDTLQAAILRFKLPRLDAGNERRRSIAARYRAALTGVGDVVLPSDPGDAGHVYHLFVVRTSRRDALRDFLRSAGVNAGIHYPIPPHLQELDAPLGYRRGDFPVTETCAQTVLSLPVSPELEDRQVDDVCERIDAFFRA